MTSGAAGAFAGVDGCPAGWIAVVWAGREPAVSIFPRFTDLIEALPNDTVIAVDMPIGLPERGGPGGRGAEQAARANLRMRQSSVFSIPSRAAIYAECGPFASWEETLAAHKRASQVARETSDPSRGVAIQAFCIFPKIREIDAVLRAEPALAGRIIESHPELAFWRLNGERAMEKPKKIRGRVNPEGMEERRELLARHGFVRDFLDRTPPRGAAADDFLDACAVSLIARCHGEGRAVPFPDPPLRDAYSLPVAIWA